MKPVVPTGGVCAHAFSPHKVDKWFPQSMHRIYGGSCTHKHHSKAFTLQGLITMVVVHVPAEYTVWNSFLSILAGV